MKSVTATDYMYNPSYLQLQEQLDDLNLEPEIGMVLIQVLDALLRLKHLFVIDLEHQAQVTLEHELANR